MSFNLNGIRFTDPQPELFSNIADNAAYDIRSGGKDINKTLYGDCDGLLQIL